MTDKNRHNSAIWFDQHKRTIQELINLHRWDDVSELIHNFGMLAALGDNYCLKQLAAMIKNSCEFHA